MNARKRVTCPWPAVRPRALGPVQRAVLWALLCTPAMTVDEVARDLGRAPKLVWEALDRLHGFGLVVRWGHEMTPQGATPWVYAATKLGRRELNARTGGRMVARGAAALSHGWDGRGEGRAEGVEEGRARPRGSSVG